MPRPSRLALALAGVLSALSVVMVAPAAHAQDRLISDPAGDVSSWRPDDVWSPAPTRWFGDVVSTRLRHTDYRVWIRFRFADLAQVDGEELAINLRVKTDEGLRRLVSVQTGPGWWDGRDAWMAKASGREIECAGLISRFDYDRDVVRFGIPRGCLSNPAWVQVKANVQTRTWGGEGGSDYYVDDPFLAVPVKSFPSDQQWSPRIYRFPFIR